MLTRPIPSTGEELPVIGLGTYRAFDVRLNRRNKSALETVLKTFFAAGGTLIDSSPMYGRAESTIGELLDGLNSHDTAFIATKVWTRGGQQGIDAMKDSLALLRCNAIELMQVHNLLDCDTQLKTLRAWKEQGKIRYLGITHFTVSGFGELARIVEREPIDFIQFPYSIMVRDAEEYLLPFAADHGVATLINRPFEQQGLFRAARQFDLPDWATEIGCESWAQFFLKYILGNSAVTCVIPATSHPNHMSDNLKAGLEPLPDKQYLKKMADYFDNL